jgi:fructose-bisphosphate aldolase class 1
MKKYRVYYRKSVKDKSKKHWRSLITKAHNASEAIDKVARSRWRCGETCIPTGYVSIVGKWESKPFMWTEEDSRP